MWVFLATEKLHRERNRSLKIVSPIIAFMVNALAGICQRASNTIRHRTLIDNIFIAVRFLPLSAYTQRGIATGNIRRNCCLPQTTLSFAQIRDFCREGKGWGTLSIISHYTQKRPFSEACATNPFSSSHSCNRKRKASCR